LIANILRGSIMRIVDQHPLPPSAHKVTEEPKNWVTWFVGKRDITDSQRLRMNAF
jgi:hypothetical protein